MSDLWTCLPSGGWPRFACDVVWQSTLVGLFAWCVLHLFTRQPAMRAWIALLALAACLVTPVGSAVLRSGGYGLIAGSETPVSDAIRRPQTSPAVGSEPLLLVTSDEVAFVTFQADDTPAAERGISWWPVLGAVWAAASLWFGGRLLLSLIGLRRLTRTAVACSDKRIVAAAADAARRVGLSRAPGVAISGSVSSPTVLALGRPCLFIPPRSASAHGEPDWLGVFCHELAHVRRGDGWGRLLGELAVVLLPWQPLVRLIRRAYHGACDEACDDWAVAVGVEPVSLASTLTEWIPWRAPMLAVGVVGSSNVRARILRLLSLRELPRHRLGFVGRLGSMMVALVLAAGVAAAQVREVEPVPLLPPLKVPRRDSQECVDRAYRAALKRTGWNPYVIERPDILEIELTTPVLKAPLRIREGERLRIAASGAPPKKSIFGTFKVNSEGEVDLGNKYGSVRVLGLTPKQAQEAIKKHLSKPEVEYLSNDMAAGSIDGALLVERHVSKAPRAPEVVVLFNDTAATSINGAYLVGPDGTVNLRSYGSVHVAGKTLSEAEQAVEKHLAEFLLRPAVSLVVAASNSKVYYVIIRGAGNTRDNVIRIPFRGEERVLDAVALAGPLPPLSGRKIWISRPHGIGSSREQILPVDWKAINRRGSSDTNHLILPGDRLYIADRGQPGRNGSNEPPGVGTVRASVLPGK